MFLLYEIAVGLTGFFLRIAALFNNKLKLFVNGRKETFKVLQENIGPDDRVLWFHCASLGEFEQGRPVMEALRKDYPKHKFVLTFFSPSGYEVQKNYTSADAVVYLPLDTRKHAKQFLDLTHPEMAFFIKYEFWPNILKELKTRKTETLLISGIFRKNHVFFKSYGSWMRKSLQSFTHFFVQDENSKYLLNGLGFTNVTISGDTRFDRVFEIAKNDNHVPLVNSFKKDRYLLVAGSTWPDDEKLLLHYINAHLDEDEKVLIAPHEINPERIASLCNKMNKKSALYSENKIDDSIKILIVDTVGLLTKIYSYADTAYVGGGFGKEGIHNVLEPATFGVPVVTGPHFDKFKEGVDLVQLKGMLPVNGQDDFNKVLKKLYKNTVFRQKTGQICKDYILQKHGATELILAYVHKKL